MDMKPRLFISLLLLDSLFHMRILCTFSWIFLDLFFMFSIRDLRAVSSVLFIGLLIMSDIIFDKKIEKNSLSPNKMHLQYCSNVFVFFCFFFTS